MTYIAAEPEKREFFVDMRGQPHVSRDQAIQQNFNYDFLDAVSHLLKRPGEFGDFPLTLTAKAIKAFARANPDMVRVIIGDRDET